MYVMLGLQILYAVEQFTIVQGNLRLCSRIKLKAFPLY